MRRLLLFTLVAVLLLLALPLQVAASDTTPQVSAASFVLMDAASGDILAAKDADVRRPMASTTKIMTALVVLETLPLDTLLTVDARAVGIEGSSIYLYTGERITVRTLLYALLLSSANDAAVALALACDGSVEAFAARMNEKAAALSLRDTHFCNPNGLHETEHYTTARDLATLTRAALANETFREIVATKRYVAPQDGTDATRLFVNHNRLLRTLDGCIGVKTGFTRAAGRCLVSASEKEGLTLIAVTLNAPDDWRDHSALHEWGHARFVSLTLPTPTISLPVVGGERAAVSLSPTRTVCVRLPRDHGELTYRVIAPHFLFADVREGTRYGTLCYYEDGTCIAEIPLVACEDVATAHTAFPLRILQFFKRIFNS